MDNDKTNEITLLDFEGFAGEGLGEEAVREFTEYMDCIRGDRSWKDVAKDAGVSEGLISLVRKGKRPITEDVAEKLVKSSDMKGFESGMLVRASKYARLAVESEYSRSPIRPDRRARMPRDTRRAFESAFEWWIEKGVERSRQMDRVYVPDQEPKCSVPFINPDMLYRTDCGDECIIKFLYVPESDDVREVNARVPFLVPRGLSGDKVSEEEKAYFYFKMYYIREVLVPALFARHDMRRRIIVITNSKSLYTEIMQYGKSMSYRGSMFAMLADLEKEVIVNFFPFEGNEEGL